MLLREKQTRPRTSSYLRTTPNKELNHDPLSMLITYSFWCIDWVLVFLLRVIVLVSSNRLPLPEKRTTTFDDSQDKEGISYHISIWSFPCGEVMYGLNTSIRFLLVLTFLDPWVSIPFQFLYTAVDLFVYVFVLEGTSAGMQVGPLCFGPFFICLLSIAASILIDSVLRARIYALLDTADAESLVSSFRRVLRGVCDGEVLLDSHMNVAKEAHLVNIVTNDMLKRLLPLLLLGSPMRMLRKASA